MLLAFVMDIIVFCKSHRIDIDPGSHTANEAKALDSDYVDENLLHLQSVPQEVDDDHHMKIAIREEI